MDFFLGGFDFFAIADNRMEETFRTEDLGTMASDSGHLMNPTNPEIACKIFWSAYGFMEKQL